MSLKQDVYGKCSCGRQYAKQEGDQLVYNLSGCNPYVPVGDKMPVDLVHWMPNGRSVSRCRNPNPID